MPGDEPTAGEPSPPSTPPSTPPSSSPPSPESPPTPPPSDSGSAPPAAPGAPSATPTGEPLLRAANVRKAFGGLRAVDGMGLDVRVGELVALIGPNGAGKTTFFHLLAGALRPDAGSIRFGGRDVAGRPAHAVARLGLVRTFQIARALGRMTVLENMLLAAPRNVGEGALAALALRRRVRAVEEENTRAARALLERFDLDALRHTYAGSLSGGQRKLLEMARALMTRPRMLLLDEPLAGVNPTLAEAILDRVHELRREGLTFLVVEHNMDAAFRHFPRVVVMAEGKKLAEGSPDEVRANAHVVEAYLGG